MKTKVFILLAALFFSTAAFAQEVKTMYVMKNDAVIYQSAVSEIDSIVYIATTESVIINGVIWASRNVAAPGTFAANPEDAGMFYQWNRKVAWPATGDVTNWDISMPTGTAWEKDNDPSPVGWRVPTLEEIQKLLDTEKVRIDWTIVNDVSGREFTDKATCNSIFLPAAGLRHTSVGMLSNVGLGYYWSSTQDGNFDYAYYLFFAYSPNDWWGIGSNFRNLGLSVRPVADK